MLRVLSLIIGITFITGGGVILKGSMDARNLPDTAFFGLFGIGIGIFLVIVAILGPPD